MISTINEGQNVLLDKPGKKPNYSTFPIGAPIADTDRYGEYKAVGFWNVVEDDRLPIFLPSETRSYTLKAPMMQRPTQKMDAFFVPLQSIIPNAHDNFVKNPLKGDDIPKEANTVVEEFENKIREVVLNEEERVTELFEALEAGQTIVDSDGTATTAFLRLITFIDMMYNPGNLLTALGRPMYKHFKRTGKIAIPYTEENLHNVGLWYDTIIREWIKNLVAESDGRKYFLTTINGQSIRVICEGTKKPGEIDLRTWLYMLRDDYSLECDGVTYKGNGLIVYVNNGTTTLELYYTITAKTFTENANNDFNYERAVAYQIVCAHFYTNNKIDYIYTAQLWRQNLGSLISSQIGALSYTYNGIDIFYDWTSGYYMNRIINLNEIEIFYEYARLLFGWNRSLRFIDYFTGARSEPLAVGNTEVAVNDGKVDILEVIKTTQATRYLQAIRTSGTWEEQIKKLFHKEPKYDYHNPMWLAHFKNNIGEEQTENTADEQYATTAGQNKLPAITGQFVGSNRFGFRFNNDTGRKGIIVAIRYYDIPRLYVEGIDSFTKKGTRYDMFNPFMQYIGDQEIFSEEIDMTYPSDAIFGYTGRDMEYKTAVGKARGGFVFNLPGYAFIADKMRPFGPDGVNLNIGPSYIRSIETELDEFYSSLVGYSLDSYFHFIVLTHAQIDAVRPMTYNPQLLK